MSFVNEPSPESKEIYMVIRLRLMLVPFVFLLVGQGALAEKYEDDLSLQVPGMVTKTGC